MPVEDGKEVVSVPTTDPKQKKDEEKAKNLEKDILDEDENAPKDELSPEDEELKESLDLAVSRLTDKEQGVQKLALETLRTEIRTSTASMTSVPKPLKFLRPHYDGMRKTYESYKDGENKRALADILAVLSMTMGEEGKRESLKFKLKGNSTELGDWGHEFVRHLAGEVGEEYQSRMLDPESLGLDAKDVDLKDIMQVVDAIVPFHMQHNAEPEAVDVLIEVQKLEKLLESPHLDENNYQRICQYLLACADYMSDPDDLQALLETAYQVYMRVEKYANALRAALRMGDNDKVAEVYSKCQDDLVKKQMAFILARHRSNFEYEDDETTNELIGNNSLSEHFLHLARELDVMEAKTPEDIYKSHLSETASTARLRESGAPVDSARHNLASTFVNAFVNAGFGEDKLVSPEGSSWLYKNKEHGMMAASASLGMVMLWNVEEALTAIDKFLYSAEDLVKAGAVLAVGVVSSSVRNECDPALALLSEHLEEGATASHEMKIAAALGLGMAYAGTAREDVSGLLLPVVFSQAEAAGADKADEEMKDQSSSSSSTSTAGSGSSSSNNNNNNNNNNNDNSGSSAEAEDSAESAARAAASAAAGPLITEVSLAALALGMVFVGSCDEEVAGSLLQRLMECSQAELDHSMSRFLCLGLGLLFLGKQDKADAMIEAVRTVEHRRGQYAAITLETCAYAGSGNVLKVQQLLHLCAEHLEKEEEAAAQGPAVLGIALTTMGESVGSEMAVRTFDHLLQYGELPIRRVVPLALALMHISDPDFAVVDTLSRLTHDSNAEVAQTAILGLGLLGAGTNNSRIAGLLRQLADFYSREPEPLFMVRIAQGLLHTGKGLISMNPFHSDRLIMSGVSMAGILTVMHAALDLNHTILGKFHYLLYTLVTAMQPRMLVTVDEDLKPLPVTVRVGQAVETVGQAGKPKTITGFQTHTTPVLLSVKDRAELATEEYLALTDVLEGLVMVKKNPDYEAEQKS